MNTSLTRFIIASAYGAASVALLVTLLTIIGEEYAPLKNGLKNIFSHHWLGKSVLSCVAFVVVTGVTYPLTAHMNVSRALWTSISASILSATSLTIYFILHTLHWV